MAAAGDPTTRLLAGVVADDLSGAVATATLLAQAGLRTRVGLTAAGTDPLSDVLVRSTQSRHLSPVEAAAAVASATQSLARNGARHLAKRIDSTLRGNLGAELAAALAAWCADRPDRGARVLLTPAWPDAGRTVRDGTLFMDGRPFARVGDTVRSQSALTTVTLPLRAVRSGDVRDLADRLDALAGAAQVVVADAEQGDDLGALAEAVDVVEGRDGAGLYVLADTGPLVQARLALARRRTVQAPVLVAAGTAAATTATQLDELEATVGSKSLPLDPALLLAGDEGYAAAQAATLRTLLAAAAAGAAVVVRSHARGAPPLALSSDDEARLVAGVAGVVSLALAAVPVLGIVASGGETAAALCRQMGVHTLVPVDAPLPLTGHVRTRGGPSDLDLVTKGGMVGDRRTLVRLVHHLTVCPFRVRREALP